MKVGRTKLRAIQPPHVQDADQSATADAECRRHAAAADAEEGGRDEAEGHIDRRRIAHQPVDEQPAGSFKLEQDDRKPGNAFGAEEVTRQIRTAG